MKLRFLGVAFLVSVVAAQLGFAQPFVVVGVDQRSYPTISANVIAFDNAGSIIQLAPGDIAVRQDGTEISATTSCEAATSGRLLSLMTLVDVSSSTSAGTPSALDIEKAGAKAGELMLASTGDERGLAAYDANATLVVGLTTTRTSYSGAVDALFAGRGSRLSEGLNNVPLGALSQLQNARNGRALLILTDGGTSIDATATLAIAKTFGIQVYIIGVNTTLSADLKKLADSSNGVWVDNITTAAEAGTHARAFVAHAKRLQTCTVTWTTAANCAPTHVATLRRGSLSRTVNIDVPVGILSLLSANVTGLDFGAIAPGSSRELQLILTARNAPIQINSISSSDPHFVVSSGAIPPVVTLTPNQTHVVRVTYTATDSNMRVVPLTIAANACSVDDVYMRGGFIARDNQLAVVKPNGGEDFLAGRATTIQWTGVLPTDIVRLESSTDDGSTWRSITEAASGLEYVWLPGPGVTTRGRIRVQRTSIDETKIVRIEDQREPVYASAFTHDGAFVITGGDDKTVRLYNATTGVLTRLVGTHTDWVWTVATHPTREIVASGSHDGTVRIWDYTTGSRDELIPVGPKVYSVEFSADGNTLYVGSQDAVSSYNTSTWDLIQRVTTSGIAHSVVPSADGTKLAVAEGDVATIRDASTLAVITTFTGHTAPVYSAAISPDNTRLVTGSADFTVRVWNASNGTQTSVTPPASGSIHSVRFNNAGTQVLTGGGDGTAKFYNPANLALLGTLSGHTGPVYAARFNATNTSVTTASTDFTARVWNVQGMRLTEDISNAAFTVKGGQGSPAVGDLGAVSIGQGADARVLLLRNTSNDTLLINSVRIASGHVDDFDLIAPPTSAVVPPNGDLQLEVAFTPSQFGTRTAVVEFTTGTGIVRSTVTGNGVAAAIAIRSLIDFGRLIANQQSVDSTIVIGLPGSSPPVNVTDVRLVGVDAAQYSIVSGGGAFTLTQGQSRSIVLHFEPKDLGRFPALLVFDLEGGGTFVTRLYGEGTGDATIESVSSLIITTDICTPAQSVTQELTVTNGGNSTLQIYAFGIEGTDANEFSVDVPGTFPVEIPANGSRAFSVRFTPQDPGVKSARLVLTTNAFNAPFGVTVIPLIARKDTVAYELSRSTVNFDNVPEGETAIERLLLFNTGTATLRWPRGPIDLGSFLIESISPDVVGPGSQAEVVIRFKGGVAGNVYNGSYTFVDSVCSRSIQLQLVATVKTYVGFTIRIDSVATTTGTTVSVPVYITRRVNFDRTQVRSVVASISTNGTLLLPTGATPLGALVDGLIRRFTMTLPVPEIDSLSTTLQFQTFWGNDTAAFVRIDSVTLTDTVVVNTQDGRVVLTDICKEGGVRLVILPPQAASIIASSPQPMNSEGAVTVVLHERGMNSLVLTDVNGRVVQELFEESFTPGSYQVPLNASQLKSGTYFLMLTTPTQRFAHRLDILK